MESLSWDEYFCGLAMVVKEKSKDPSTKVGAIIVSAENEIISTGFNGFPRGINESSEARWERPVKYAFVEHAERNAIYNAARIGVSTKGARIYLAGLGPPTLPCTECARAVIQAGITEVIGCAHKEVGEQWLENFAFSQKLLAEAGVSFKEYKS
jgi:dCMP deaminase